MMGLGSDKKWFAGACADGLSKGFHSKVSQSGNVYSDGGNEIARGTNGALV